MVAPSIDHDGLVDDINFFCIYSTSIEVRTSIEVVKPGACPLRYYSSPDVAVAGTCEMMLQQALADAYGLTE